MASLPMQHPDKAVAELERATKKGASASWCWRMSAARRLPIAVRADLERNRPTRTARVCAPDRAMRLRHDGHASVSVERSVGFTFDHDARDLAHDLRRLLRPLSNINLITAHGGGALPFLAGRLDRCYDVVAACRTKIKDKPSAYLKRIYADSVVYTSNALRDSIETFGDDHVLYGTDFPHNIADMAGTLARIDKLDAAARDNVRGANAQRVFKLNVT
jgi:aminocarboxymuconate-semialdehyde decarboxylase